MSQIIWYMSHVLCCTSYVIYCMLEMPCILFWFHPNLSHMLHVTCYMSHVTCHMSHVTCRMLHVTCYMSQVICLMLHIICHILHIRNALHSVLISSKYISHVNLSHVTCHMLHVIWRISHVICHTLHVLGNAMDTCMLFWVHSTCVTFQSVICHMRHVTCHMSHVTCNMPHVTSHVSHVTCLISHVLGHVKHCSALFRVLDVGQMNWPYRAPRQPRRPKLKIGPSSLPRPDPQNENELWNLIYKNTRNHCQITGESSLWHLAVTWRL